jgi:UDP-3-O-[3-hydroxymyristoyl] glucosamine N-acyltransferase
MIDTRFYTVSAPRSVGDIAAQFGFALPSASMADEMIQAPASLPNSLPGEITFFANKRRRDDLKTAKATACLTTEKLSDLVKAAGMIAIHTDSPRDDFARLTASMARDGASDVLASNIADTAQVHPSAVLGQGVTIGAQTRIGANSVIGDGVVIGANCNIGPLVSVSFARIGQRCVIKSGAIVGGTGFGVAKDAAGTFTVPHLGRVIFGDDVQVGSNSCIDRGQLGDTVLSDGVKIDNLVQIAHNVFIGEGTMLAGHVGVSGSCHIGKGALFGGRASLADHITVGDGAILAAFAGVMTDIPPGEMWSGSPAMPIREHMRNVATLKKLTKR